ncbi:MAG: ferritin-like domain-containing protein [Acidimicrobiia bacterium]|nr:ferritin-like domain-containing protein [Acidimicrobiia bacterium]
MSTTDLPNTDLSNTDIPITGPDTTLPSAAEMNDAFKLVDDHAQRIFTWKYDRERDQLVTLYNKAMASQWNSVTELDWATEVDAEREANHNHPTVALARVVAEAPGSPLKNWSEKEFRQLALELQKANLSQFMHGEQGAMMVAAKIVETVPWIDAKYYASTQTMDEARHTEVFAKYLHTKLGDAYPMSPFLEEQITVLLEDSRWDIAYLGMQIIIESLALAAFGDLLRTTEEPLLKKLLRYVMADEARHVAFGILSLGEYYQELTEPELKDRQEFMLENTIRNRSRASTPEVWERMGVSFEAVLPHFMEAIKSTGKSPLSGFQRGFFAKLVPNTRKLGLLDANNGYLREQWGAAGLMEFEFAEDTASDYEAYDAVASDRAAATAN